MSRFLFAAIVALLIAPLVHAQPDMQWSTTIDLRPDDGRNFGTLFEVRDDDGRHIAGAGFAGVYNTRFRHDRLTVQFYVRPQAVDYDVAPLPRFNDSEGGLYMFDYNNRLYGGTDMYDRAIRYFDESSNQWIEDEAFGNSAFRSGDVIMDVAGKPLKCVGSQIHYDGKLLLDRPDVGYYHHFYYAAGHISFFHNNRDGDPAFSKLYACEWDPQTNQPLDLRDAAVIQTKFPGEVPFAIGQLKGKIVQSSNRGGVYVFDGNAWEMIVEPSDKTSYQLYSMINWRDTLLMAHYPSGHLYEYDGETITEHLNWPPKLPGVSGSSREAQTTCIYGGDLYVGVWPWSELWRYDEHADKWTFIQRMFTTPPLTDAVNHPYEQEIYDYIEQTGHKMVHNNWGQRLTGLVPMGDAMYASTSAKAPWKRETRLDFLTEEIFNEYGRVHRIIKPGVISARIAWTDAPTTLTFTVRDGKMTITQDNATIAETAVDAPLIDAASGKATWANGVFGPFTGKMSTHASQQP
jgi:hypothetical protein